MDRRLGRLQSRSGHYGEEKSLLPPPGIEPLLFDRPARSLVAISTELSQLLAYFLISVLNEREWSASRPFRFATGEAGPGSLL
jgi:hypothetical protein